MTGPGRAGRVLHRRILAWHRRVGLVASLLVLVVVVTGLPLNHAGRLGLDDRTVASEALLEWYGMQPRGGLASYRVGGNWLSSLGGSLYLGDRRLAGNAPAVVGAVAVGNLVVVASRDLAVFTDDGTLVERLPGDALPGPVESIGVRGDGLVAVRTPAGQFSSTVAFRDWTPSRAPVDWARAQPPPAGIESAILNSYRGGGLPWSRLLLDIHTGRILGAWGPYLIDAAAIALLVLVGTGICNWFGRGR